jgi:hypothetical protein
MTLEVHQIAAVPGAGRMPEMVLADAEQRAHRGEAGDVAAQITFDLVRLGHHDHRVPAAVGADTILERRIARRALLHVRRDGV